MRGADEVHCPECEDPECMGCVEIRSEDLSDIKLATDLWADEGGSIPPEEPKE